MSLCDKCIHRNVCGTEDARKKIGKASPFLYVCDAFIDKSILSTPKREKIKLFDDRCTLCGGNVRFGICQDCGTDM